MNDSPSSENPLSAANPRDEKKDGTQGNRKLVTGLAFGIGSAAVVAALLFASRHKKKDGVQ